MRSTNGTLRLAAVALFAFAFGSYAAASSTNCPAAESEQLNGAYRLSDGKLLSILPSGTDGQRRITHFQSGRSHRLFPISATSFESASDLDSQIPVAYRYDFQRRKDGLTQTLTIADAKHRKQTAKRIALRETPVTFKSGDTELFGKLTLPERGKSPFKTVVFVHGSDPVPSVDQEWLPHLLAANGVATFVFDKRGSGCSKGQYVQHFDVLANDVVAAVNAIKAMPDVDKNAVGLAGFSQGGWVAPLAALKDPSIKFVAVGYGLTMSMADEDRLEAPLKLKEADVDDASIAEFRELNAALHKVAREQFKDWQEFDAAMERFKDKPWLAQAKPMQTWIGVMLQMGIAQAKQAAPQMFEHFFQPFYEPVPTLEKLNIPMLWLIAEKDIEAPPEITIATLARLRQQGKPITTRVFPNTDHGLQEFEIKDGKRVRTKYAEGYFSTLLNWVNSRK